MPELPEVQTVVSHLLDAGILNRTIVNATVYWSRTVFVDHRALEGFEGDGGSEDLRDFSDTVRGRKILGVNRRGKLILLQLDGDWIILIHLRMSGTLHIGDKNTQDPHTRLFLSLDDGRVLRFHDPRKFGRWIVTRTPSSYLDNLGVEPLSDAFTATALAEILSGSRRMLKPLLLDQRVISGLGNIYVDEALWHARLHPSRRAHTLVGTEVVRLAASVRHVLIQGIKNRGTRLGSGVSNFHLAGDRWDATNQHHLRVFRRTNLPCRRCGTGITRLVLAQRGTHVCLRCQMPDDG